MSEHPHTSATPASDPAQPPTRADEPARRLEEDLRASASTTADESAALDAAALQRLGDRRDGDRLLMALSLESIAGLVDRHLARLAAVGEPAIAEWRQRAWDLLDVLRRSPLLCRITRDGQTAAWADRMLALIDASHFTVGQLFAQRAAACAGRTLFRVPGSHDSQAITWHQAAGRVELIGRGLLAMVDEHPGPVAVLSENRLEVALIDLACLSYGLVNVIIPATATDGDVEYILRHARAGSVVVSSREQAQKALKGRERLPDLRTVIALDTDASTARHVVPFEHLLERASQVSGATLVERRDRVRIDELATVMYTSGTTGTPKGIGFSHRNMVFKRFARALALPEIGEQDVFLAYLPLFHTFGRFLELQGCVFWGATYCFAQNPAIGTLVRQMQDWRPSVFISIPMKWMQLYELVRQEIDVESASDPDVGAVVRRLVGDRLRWGLSAAGYLDSEIFRFFQRYGVELMSGFGMTEATGGITMTPPGRYKDDTLGCALPGIDVTLSDSSELLVRGPYVMTGYLGAAGPEPAADDEGWFHTGDLMEMDEDGFFRIIDRKKEIYKNVKGQTIAPQKIENLFRDFESVGRVFLVGDNREFNTALIYPNPEFKELDFARLSPQERKAHFRSLVVTANSFLSPYERIVDFAVIDRDFDAARDELTPKGTFRRKVVERNFAETIRLLYRRTTFTVGGTEVTFPNWLFQALGITAQDLRFEPAAITLASVGTSLTVRRLGEEVQVGSAMYRHDGRTLDLGLLISTPRLWLGNDELVRFAPLDVDLRQGRRRAPADLEWCRRAGPYQASEADRETAAVLLRRKSLDLMELHRAALLLDAADARDGLLGVRLLETALGMEESLLQDAARRVLGRAAHQASAEVVRRAFQLLALTEQATRYTETIARFLASPTRVLDVETTAVLIERGLSPERLEVFIDEAEGRGQRSVESPEAFASTADLLNLLAEYGAAHPTRYRALRGVLNRIAMRAPAARTKAHAGRALVKLTEGFRAWLGPPSRIAVDPETGLEYRWEDVVAFDDDVDQEARERLIGAMKETPLLAEAAFLFSDRATLGLGDILPGGVWIRLLGTEHGKSVYRVSVRTRIREQFDLAVNLNRTLSDPEIEEEIGWLIVCGEDRDAGALVEDFGGYWKAHGLWTEEFIPGETLDRALGRLARRPQDDERFTGVWPHAAWSALSSYVDFWNRTGRRFVVADPTPANVIVPTHDYQTGPRLVSIAARRPFTSLVTMLQSFREQFIARVEREHPRLAGLVGWDVSLSAVLEILGEEEGCARLRECLTADGDTDRDDELRSAIAQFLSAVERRGFLPRRLFFAAQRFRRWFRINADATLHAQASTLRELYETYGLARLQATYPEARARFSRETVFRDAGVPLAEGLEDIIRRLRTRRLLPEDLSAAVADLRAALDLTPGENYFLTRLSYPYLRPEDEAELVANATGGVRQSEMVVTVLDADGTPFLIRHALSPREVGRLHRLFLAAKLNVQFRPEHRFLVAVTERGHLMGGLFYELQPEAHSAHMDKVVVSERFQRKGVAAALLEELCKRLRTAGLQSVTTGFFRPQFFYQLGFTVEGRYAGLVRSLVDTDKEPD